jgi:hypothetical protein
VLVRVLVRVLMHMRVLMWMLLVALPHRRAMPLTVRSAAKPGGRVVRGSPVTYHRLAWWRR